MEINELTERPNIKTDKKLYQSYSQLIKLLNKLKKRQLSQEVFKTINEEVNKINAFSKYKKELRKLLRKSLSRILKLIKAEHKLVIKNHYRNIWLGAGMAVFGLPFGVIFGILLDNMAFLAIGFPIGMTIGIAVGTGMDKKAFEDGRQIDLEIS